MFGSRSTQKSLSSMIDQGKYSKVTNNINGVSFMLNNNWRSLGDYRVANYDRSKIDEELTQDGRIRQTNGTYADLSDNKLRSYPYSTSTLNEILILGGEFNEKKLSTKDYINKQFARNKDKDKKRSIQELEIYVINGKEVGDFIYGESNDGLKATRFIVLSSGNQVVHYEISPVETRERVTKNNFDGLLELIGSTEFISDK